MALTPQDVDKLYDETKKLLELWMRIKLVFLKAFGKEPITKEQENSYLQLKSEISRMYRTMAENLPKGLLFDGGKMQEMLKNAMTMEHLNRQPTSERQSFYGIWHLVYIKLTRTLGALGAMQMGYFPHMHRTLLKSKTFSGKGKKKK